MRGVCLNMSKTIYNYHKMRGVCLNMRFYLLKYYTPDILFIKILYGRYFIYYCEKTFA